MKTDKRKAVIVFAVALALLVVAAVVAEALVSSGTSGPGAGGYEVTVTRDGAVLAAFTLDDLRALGLKKVTIAGKTEEGPTLLSVLEAAGVDDYRELTITGMGIRDDGSIVLEASEITDEVLLDIANRGTVKVVGPAIAWSDRVRDVTKIDVR